MIKNVKKHIACVLIVSLLLSCLLSLYPDITELQAATYKLNKTSATIYTGSTLKLKTNKLKKGYSVKWTSNNKSVAAVDSTGLVTAKNIVGSSTITATIKYTTTYKKWGKTKKKTTTKKKLKCLIHVTTPPLERNLNVTNQCIGVGNRFELSVMDADPFDTITFSSWDTSIATVDKFGNVYGRGYGSTEILAHVESPDKTQYCNLYCTVNVLPSDQTRGLNFYSKDLERFKNFELQVTNATSVDYIEYISSDPSVLTVANTGTSYTTVTGVNIGTAYVTVRIKKRGNELEEKSCRVVIKEYNKERTISVSKTSITKSASKDSPPGAQITINSQYELDKITYTPVDKKIVSVTATGGIVGLAAGTTDIVVTIQFPDGNKKELRCTITVTEPPTVSGNTATTKK